MKEVFTILEDMRAHRWEGIKILRDTKSEKGKEKLAWFRTCHKELCRAIRILKKYG